METKELDIKKNTLEQQAAKLRKQRRRQMLASTFGIIILLAGLYQIGVMFFSYKLNETSNDAQIEQYISPVNLRASGYIKKVYFTEHQTVKKGDTLMVLDDREYRIRVMEAEAALKDAMAGASVIGQTLQTTKASARFMRLQSQKWKSVWLNWTRTVNVTKIFFREMLPHLSSSSR